MIHRLIRTLNKMKELLRSNERHTLPDVICKDLFQHWKLSFCLFICIIITALLVITTVYYTRLLTAKYEQLILEYDALDIEWRNLVLEENILDNHNQVERIATEKLQIQHVDPSQGNILIQK